jgi:GT2 family glycosyltransferase
MSAPRAAPIRLPQSDRPAISIVVLLSREAELAATCLSSIAAAVDPGLPVEVIVVLNSRDEQTRRLVLEGVEGARVIATEANTGIAVGWNLAFDAARGARCALLHEDSMPEPGWLARLSATMDEHPEAAVVGARLRFPDGRFQNGGWALWRDGVVTKLTPDHAPEITDATVPYPADNVSSAGLLMDRDAWVRTGGFDERFFPSVYTDIDFNTSVWQLGRTVLSEPRALVRHGSLAMIHDAGGALTSMDYHVFLREQHRGRFLAKWGTAMEAYEPRPEGADANRAEAAAVRRSRERTLARAAAPTAVPGREGLASRALSLPAEGLRERLLDAQIQVQAEFADALHEELQAARAAIADRDLLAADRARLAAEGARLAATLNAVVAHRDGVVVERDALIVHRDRLIAERDDLAATLAARDAEVGAATARVAELDAERAELAVRSATLDQIVSGGWWRLGAPLRRVRRALRQRR